MEPNWDDFLNENSEYNKTADKVSGPLVFSNLEDSFEKMRDFRKNGLPDGISAGWPNLDENFKILRGQLNIVSGFPASGKSEWVENIACEMAIKQKWKILMYAPECYPTERHAINLIEKIVGKPLLKNKYNTEPMTDDEMYRAEWHIIKRFKIVSASGDPCSMDTILKHIEAEKPDMVVIDPFNELDGQRASGVSETDYIGRCLMMARRLSRKMNISFWIVCHPSKPMHKNTSGKYDPPDMYSLSGSAHWFNKSDNAFIVHRNDLTSTRVTVMIKKIKNRFYGKPGEVYFNFDPTCSRYIPASEEF